jgi:hypothetical protein
MFGATSRFIVRHAIAHTKRYHRIHHGQLPWCHPMSAFVALFCSSRFVNSQPEHLILDLLELGCRSLDCGLNSGSHLLSQDLVYPDDNPVHQLLLDKRKGKLTKRSNVTQKHWASHATMGLVIGLMLRSSQAINLHPRSAPDGI